MVKDPHMESNEQSDLVGQAQKLIAVFNHWPSFHDAQVLWACLDREDCSLRLKIYVFESTKTTTRDTDESGYFRIIKECYVILRFQKIENFVLEEFNHQNVIAGLIFKKDSEIRVEVEPIFGVYGSWSCRSIEIEDVQSCKPACAPAGTPSLGLVS